MLRLAWLIDCISTSVGVAAAILVIPLGRIMTYEAFARFLMNWPTFWAYELSYMLTGAHFALGVAVVTRRNEHIRVDFLYARMPARWRAVLDFLVLLFGVTPVVTWVAWGLVDYAWAAYMLQERSGESGWNPLIWPVRTLVAAGFVFFALQLVSETIKTGALVLSGTETERDP